MNFRRLSLQAILLSLLISNAYALPLPPVADPAGRERELQRREQTLQERRQIQQRDEQLVAPDDEVEAPDAGPSFVLNSVRFTKSELLTADELKAIVLPYLLIRPDLSVIQAAYFTYASWKNFFTRSGEFSKSCMCSAVAAFNLALVRTGTLV